MSSICSGVGYESLDTRTHATWPVALEAGVAARPASQPPGLVSVLFAPDGTGNARAAFVIASWSTRSAVALVDVFAGVLHWMLVLVGSPIGTTRMRRAFVLWSTLTIFCAFVSVPVVVIDVVPVDVVRL